MCSAPILIFLSQLILTVSLIVILVHAAILAGFRSVTLTKRIGIILLRNIAFSFGDLLKKFSKKTVGTFRNTFPIALPVTIVSA